ncbi:hypothetical protein [Mesonia sp. K7]|uniref:hypothetical protein n=1 Tax=Mesonia sp. K7 TaxID=2218606 RepID=UPI000DA9351F|nr:hypothetical protein [Mesonia sp. K7]PZD79220.1 hypothetical protein DNG35_01650 [Mesonia sp. K7]
MNDKNKRAPLLDKDLENEQNIENEDYPGEPNSKPKDKKPEKNDSKKMPEANDPAGYSKKERIKKSPYDEENKSK